MAISATSSIAKAVDNLRNLVAASTTFQERLGVETAEDALTKVYLHRLELLPTDEREDRHRDNRPYAVIWQAEGDSWQQYAEGQQYQLRAGGELSLYLTANSRLGVDGSDVADFNDDMLDFANFYGGVMDDLSAASGVNENLPIARMSVNSVRGPDPFKTQLNFWEALIGVSWT